MSMSRDKWHALLAIFSVNVFVFFYLLTPHQEAAHEELKLQEREETHDSTAMSEAEITEQMKSDTKNKVFL